MLAVMIFVQRVKYILMEEFIQHIQGQNFQDYPENFRGDTETTRTTASDFIRPSIESRAV